MKNINPIIADDTDFARMLFELEQINLRLLLELKQQQKFKGGKYRFPRLVIQKS